MFFQCLGFLSGLAYLAFCLLIAVSGARKKCLRDGLIPIFEPKESAQASTISQSVDSNAGQRPAFALSKSLFLCAVSCLISLSLFLFMPCGTLPSLIPASGGALIVIGGLAATLGIRGWERLRRRGCVPLCLGVCLLVMAQYARQRGIPGDLYTLDAYAAMPVINVAETEARLGFCVLAAASLLAMRKALPAMRLSVPGGKCLRYAEAFLLEAIAGELWLLAAAACWVCLFFPLSFTYVPISGLSVLSALVLNALFFWAKVLGLKWLMEKWSEKRLYDSPPFHALILFALLVFGVWLLLDVSAE